MTTIWEKEECCICFEKMEQIKTSCCRHPFCFSCLKKALNYKESCPICRAHIEDEENSPACATELPKNLVENGDLRGIENFLTERLINHASKIWKYDPLGNWKKFLEKGLSTMVAIPEMTVSFNVTDESPLYKFDLEKILFFKTCKEKLLEERAIDVFVAKVQIVILYGEEDTFQLNIAMCFEYSTTNE